MAEQDDKKVNWRELRDFCNSLPEDQLDKDVMWWGVEDGGRIDECSLLEEDYGLAGENEDGIFPKSEYDSNPDNFDEEFKTVHPKGTPLLYFDK